MSPGCDERSGSERRWTAAAAGRVVRSGVAVKPPLARARTARRRIDTLELDETDLLRLAVLDDGEVLCGQSFDRLASLSLTLTVCTISRVVVRNVGALCAGCVVGGC